VITRQYAADKVMGDDQCLQQLITSTTANNAASVKMSAQETVFGHSCSTCALIWSMTSKPLNELLF
jgi:hypothetical protein